MKWRTILVLLPFLVLTLFSQEVVLENPVRFLALGDSYTIGQAVAENDRWPNQLVKKLIGFGFEVEELRIIARTGWRTDNLLDAIEKEKPDSSYNLVSLLIGVNNQYQGVDFNVYPVEFRKLLNQAITFCGGNKSGVFVLSIPDYGYTPYGEANQETISAELDKYNFINKSITKEMGVAYFDITPISRQVEEKPYYIASDKLHPSGEMYSKWVELIVENIVLRINNSEIQLQTLTEHLSVYPNPASNSINLEIPENANLVVFYNMLGAITYKSDIVQIETLQIDISNWEKGLYFYKITLINDESISGKFMVR